MPNFSKLIIAGHVGKCDEIKFAGQNNTPVLKFSLAVNTGFGQNKTCSWYSCSYWGKQAESVAQYIAKGKAVLVSGELSLRDWESNGKRGTSADVRVENITLLGGKDDGGHQDAPAAPAEQQPQSTDEIPF